jgi:hypothetical protein
MKNPDRAPGECASFIMVSHCEACKNSGGAENGCPGCGHEEEIARLTDELAKYKSMLKHASEDWAEDDTTIRELARPILGDLAVDGTPDGVPPIVDIVRELVYAVVADLKA